MKKRSIVLIFLLNLVWIGNAVNVGSDSVVERFNSVVVLQSGDKIASFSAIVGGLKFASLGSDVTFDSLFPVSGTIDLRGGTLTLNRNFILSDLSNIVSLGQIEGNLHKLELSISTTYIPSYVAPTCDLLQVTTQQLNDDPFSVDWSFDNKFIAIGLDGNDDYNELLVYKFENNLLTLQDSVELSDKDTYVVRWHPSKYILATGRSNVSGAELMMFEFDTIAGTLSELTGNAVDVGNSVQALSWHPSGNYLVVGSKSNSREIELYSFNATTSVLDTTPIVTINLSPSRDVQTESMAWNYDGGYLAIGLKKDGSNPEFLVYDFDKTASTMTLNASSFINSSVCSVDWNATNTTLLAVGLKKSNSSNLLRIYQHNESDGMLVQKSAVSLKASVFQIAWNLLGNCLAIGMDGHKEEEFRIYELNASSFVLSEIFRKEFSADIDALRWSRDGKYLIVGDDTNQITLYRDNVFFNDPFTISNVTLSLSNNIELHDVITTFNGFSNLNGNGNMLCLGPQNSLVIGSNSTLRLKDIHIKGIKDVNIRCTDSTSHLILENVVWEQSGDYCFNQGALQFKNKVSMKGPHSFVYQTSQTSTVLADTKLKLDKGFTFSYDPISIVSQDLLEFIDDSSKLILNSATLHSTATGWNLKRGALQVKGKSILFSEVEVGDDARKIDLGITFGDGISNENDFICEVRVSAELKMTQGSLNYKNVSLSSCISGNSISGINMDALTTLRIYQDLPISPGSVVFGNNATLARVQGKTIIGAIKPKGQLGYIMLAG